MAFTAIPLGSCNAAHALTGRLVQMERYQLFLVLKEGCGSALLSCLL